MKRFLSILALLCITIATIAQSEDPESAAFDRIIPSDVRLRLDAETGEASLIFLASPTICEELITEISIEGNIIDVDVYAPLGYEDEVCNTLVAFEPIIELGELEPDTAYVLFLNDFATQFFLPQPTGTIMGDVAFPMTWDTDNQLFPFMRVDSFVDELVFSFNQDMVFLDVRGAHPDGCQTDTHYWLRQDEFNPEIYYFEVFRLIPDGVMCPAVITNFEILYGTGIALEEDFYIEVAENWYRYVNNDIEPITYTPLTIESVNIVQESDGFSVTVLATGISCSLNTDVENRDYASFIQLYFLNRSDFGTCSESTESYEEIITVETLPVIINGIAYDENGILPSNAQSSPPREPEGNFMQVDTVIESVEILVLESFPMQLDLVISGYQADGCEAEVFVEQSVEGNNVNLHIYRELPPDVMCPMVLVPYEETIRVNGSFEGGTVEIQVNDFNTSIDL